MSLGTGIWSELLQHGFFKHNTEQKLVCAKESGEIALRTYFYGMEVIQFIILLQGSTQW
jgi:hypothetical protein